MFNSINIIGYGFVGAAMGYLCEQNKITYNVCDMKNKVGKFNYFTNNIEELINYSENKNDINYYFVAVPTPSNNDGSCNISIIEDVLTKLNNLSTKKTRVIIKSTVVPGSCQQFYNKFKNINIILSPEFLRESTFQDDMYNANFVLVGISSQTEMSEYTDILKLFRMLYIHNNNLDIYMKSYEECELFKYTLNTFFASKIIFFNEIYELCEAMNVNYEKLKLMFNLDSRIGSYGITVPGDDGKFGYGKSCLPKELNGMIKLREQLGLHNAILTEIRKKNNLLRLK